MDLSADCIQNLLTLLLNGIGILLVATGVGSEVGVVLLGINAVLQLKQIFLLVERRHLLDEECFRYLLLINIVDMIPGLGALSGLFNAIHSCMGVWAFQLVHKPCDYP